MQGKKVLALAAGAAVLMALPATADAKRAKRFYRSGWEAHAKIVPAANQTAKGHAFLRQHDGALTIAVKIVGLTPWTVHPAHIHTGSCAPGGGAIALPLPDLIANGRGIAKVWITLATEPGKDFAENGFYVNVHKGGADPDAGDSITCGDIVEHVANGAARVKPLGTNTVKGAVGLRQIGDKVDQRIQLNMLEPSTTHHTAIHLGTCAAPGAKQTDLSDVVANINGKVRLAVQTGGVATDVVAPGMIWVVKGSGADADTPIGCGEITGRWGPREWPGDGDPWWHRWWF